MRNEPMTSSRSLTPSIVVLLLAGAVGYPRGACGAELVLSERRVFPEAMSASPATLDRPLNELWPGGHPPEPGALSIAIHKAKRRLDVLANRRIVKSYIVNLGLAPVGDKEREGDYRTPEGNLFICARSTRSQFTRFLALAYPSPEHVARGIASGRVSNSLEPMVREAYGSRDRCPPQRSGLGGAIGIHGSGTWTRTTDSFRVVDWTWGCVALRDVDILELFQIVRVGTPVRILPE